MLPLASKNPVSAPVRTDRTSSQPVPQGEDDRPQRQRQRHAIDDAANGIAGLVIIMTERWSVAHGPWLHPGFLGVKRKSPAIAGTAQAAMAMSFKQ